MIRVKQDKQYLSYILEDNANFFPTGYRVLKKQKDKGIMVCSKVNYNGQIKLLYSVVDKESIFSASEYWDLKAVFDWILRFVKTVMEVQENGFLRVEDIDVNLSRVFLNEEKKQVYLVVLPLTSDTEYIPNWHREFERSLIEMIDLARVRDNSAVAKIKEIVKENSTTLEFLYRKLKHLGGELNLESDTSSLKKQEEVVLGELHLVANTTQKIVDVAITREIFVLGKNPKMSDFAIDLSPTISRQHCRITQEKDGYYLEDLGSLNHTYLDGVMLVAGQKLRIKKDSVVRLAEIEFSVEFRN